ncbi:CRS1 / YhbY (CRM) domain-containing protein [Rhynchospora pubera]|uniref:CRM-domain containing factor CFM3, chloroplastic/mitochondrial n=1 Tax=Rhynchospora pubera TaxID=906938 RepID=A0AAV8C482_9POAL|nr:CRS1 / YhbY (CRM) domain-containing protein [Rhynchospora pubera]KAJ4796734.1 CRS1 / YhbY (CRM) domain-containing protein [Rhynchospora pubera]
MALSTAKFTSSLPFHPSLPITSHLRFRLFSASPPRAPWLQQWAPLDPAPSPPPPSKPPPPASTSIERIVHRLRNLGVDNDEEEEPADSKTPLEDSLDGTESLSDLLQRSWNRPDQLPLDSDQTALLPWEREKYNNYTGYSEDGNDKSRRPKAPSMAELTIEDEELRRLRRLGMSIRERVTVAKAGVTQAVAAKIHDVWRKSELVRLKFHESLAHDMRTAHQLVERRTGGLVIWRSGSTMVVYRGANYKYPSEPPSLFKTTTTSSVFIPDVSTTLDDSVPPSTQHPVPLNRTITTDLETLTEEEVEFNKMLDELGPRFVDWWGTGVLPVDADLLPEKVNGYKTPFRLLPTGMRSRLTNAELTNLRKLARKLPCHFALGRNRHHQGLAQAILKLWEKSLVAKIAVKRGVQNTNNKLMAEELKRLTGGTLLQRNKFFIVIYRGKDFLPSTVASALAERQELADDIQNIEERTRGFVGESLPESEVDGNAPVGTLAEFRQAMAQWGREVTPEEREAMREEASRIKKDKLFKRIAHKLSIAQAKKMKAERILAKVEAGMVPVGPSDDREMITDEERSVFRRIGLRMKSYLPMGIRGVFDGVIENMHLHWKHRELVKLLSKQKTLAFVEDTARLLEYESGGILVAIERVPKGFVLIYYRGKNYRRPISIRPRNLLTKAKALQRAIAMQRHEALSQHILQLEGTIRQMKLELGLTDDEGEMDPLEESSSITPAFQNESEDESSSEFDDDEYDDDDDDDDDITGYDYE